MFRPKFEYYQKIEKQSKWKLQFLKEVFLQDLLDSQSNFQHSLYVGIPIIDLQLSFSPFCKFERLRSSKSCSLLILIFLQSLQRYGLSIGIWYDFQIFEFGQNIISRYVKDKKHIFLPIRYALILAGIVRGDANLKVYGSFNNLSTKAWSRYRN